MKRIVAIGAALAAMTLTGMHASAESKQVKSRIEYYSDVGLTNQVGLEITYCDWSTDFWGRYDVYSRAEYYDCD